LRRPLEPGQYLSISYTERLSEAGAVTSVGSRGDAYDNALAETINGLYKTEVIKKRGPWKTIEDVEFATLEWVDWFNNRRLLEPIGLAQAGAVTSVGSRGDAYDNALAETINGLYKTEVIKKRGPWKTIEDVEFATLEWVDWFNNRRLLEPIGYIPPTEFEDMYYREQSPVEDEGLKQMSLH